MRVPSELYEGISLETMIQRMDDAGIERAMLIAAKVGDRNHSYCYHVPYDLVKEAVQQYPNRFYALAGLDPTEGMNGVRALEKAVKEDSFIGAHFYPHWFELAPDHARWYPFMRSVLSLIFRFNCKLGNP